MNERRGQRPVADAIHAPEKSKAPAPLSQAVPEGEFADLQAARNALDEALAFAPDSERWGRWNRGVVELDMALSRHPQPQAVTEDARDGERKPTDEDQALDLLALLFEAYEEGPSCYEDPEDGTGFLGHAVRMDHEDFHRCADLLNRRRPVDAAHRAQASSGKGAA